jgi:hypothetical protein
MLLTRHIHPHEAPSISVCAAFHSATVSTPGRGCYLVDRFHPPSDCIYESCVKFRLCNWGGTWQAYKVLHRARSDYSVADFRIWTMIWGYVVTSGYRNRGILCWSEGFPGSIDLYWPWLGDISCGGTVDVVVRGNGDDYRVWELTESLGCLYGARLRFGSNPEEDIRYQRYLAWLKARRWSLLLPEDW